MSGPFGGLELRRTDAQDVSIDSAERGTDPPIGNMYGGFKKARSILGSFVFSLYLLFHTSNSGQIWYLRKAIIEDYPTYLGRGDRTGTHGERGKLLVLII